MQQEIIEWHRCFDKDDGQPEFEASVMLICDVGDRDESGRILPLIYSNAFFGSYLGPGIEHLKSTEVAYAYYHDWEDPKHVEGLPLWWAYTLKGPDGGL